MINSVVLEGRLVDEPKLLVRDPEITTKPKCRFRLAVPRNYKKEGRPTADFFNCVAFDQQAVYLAQHGRKGGRISLRGRAESGYFDQEDGTRCFYTMMIASEVCVLDYREDRPSDHGVQSYVPLGNQDFFEEIPDPADVPFLND